MNLIPAEDLEDLDSEQTDLNYEDYDEKLLMSDKIEMNQCCIPTLNIKKQ